MWSFYQQTTSSEESSSRLSHALMTAENLIRGVWRLSDPKISLASLTSIFLATCIASTSGAIQWFWLALTVLGILCLEAAKNASGDVFDYDSGTDSAVSVADRSPFSGGKRVIIDGLMTRTQTIIAAAIFYVLGILIGLTITIYQEPGILFIGIAGVALAYFYNAPPAKLSYRGFGELAVAITYGPLICCGAYLVQRHTIPLDVILYSTPLGLLIAAFLVINEFPDRKADQGAGKRNLVVLLGEVNARRFFLSIILAANLMILCLPLFGAPSTILFGLAGLPFGIGAIRRIMKTKVTAMIIPAQKWALLSFVFTAAGSGLGLIL